MSLRSRCNGIAYFLGAHVFLIVVCVLCDLFVLDHVPEGVELLDQELVQQLPRWCHLFTRWDAAHFLNISLNGYKRDYSYAFFPLYPVWLSMVTDFGIGLVIRFGLLSNIILHWGSYLALSKILHRVLPSVNEDYLILLCAFGPAGIFFVTLYSESLFSFLSWTGLALAMIDGSIFGSLFLALASITRSNGIFNIIPLLMQGFISLMETRTFPSFIRTLSFYTFSCASCFIPSLCWHYLMFRNLCYDGKTVVDYSICDEEPSIFSFLSTYSKLQSKYWNVGFLKQYHWRQLPNFVLAFPILYFSIFGLILYFNRFFAANYSRKVDLTLLPWVAHLLVNIAVCLLFAHVQVSTRVLLASCPYLYVILLSFTSNDKKVKKNSNGFGMVWIYCITYCILGAVLHINNYPWT